MDYLEKVSITFTKEEWSLIARCLEKEAFFKLHSYHELHMMGACNLMGYADKIKEIIQED